jgi:anti-sigma factor RsiW
MIDKLDNNENILLMYLADELPAEDRLEVEQMLRIDGSMRLEFDRLQAAQEVFDNELGMLDELQPLPTRPDAAVRRVGREMRQWAARPRKPITAAGGQARSTPRRWAMPATAAALFALAIGIWVGTHRESTSDADQMAVLIEQQRQQEMFADSVQQDQDHEQLAASISRDGADAAPLDTISEELLDISGD